MREKRLFTHVLHQAKTKVERMFQRKNQDVLSEHYHKLVNFGDENGSDDEEDFMTVQRVNHDLSGDEEEGSDVEHDIKVCCATHAFLHN